MVKAFNVSFDYVLFEMSYANLLMYSSVLPSYDTKKKTGSDDSEWINGDDPEAMKKYLASIRGNGR